MLATIFALKTFRQYLYGRQFILYTDHRPLVWVNSMNDPTSRVMRWRERLKEFVLKILYKAGRINTNADALSRNPVDIRTADVFPIKVKWRNRDGIIKYPGIARTWSSSDLTQNQQEESTKRQKSLNSTSRQTDSSETELLEKANDSLALEPDSLGFAREDTKISKEPQNDSLASEPDFLGFPREDTKISTEPQNNSLSLEEDFLGFPKSLNNQEIEGKAPAE